MSKAVRSLASYQVVIDQSWLKEAESAEQAQAPRVRLSCGIRLGVEVEDRKRTWLDDADVCLARSSIATARTTRTLYPYSRTKRNLETRVFPRKEARLLQQLQETLKKAVECCPQAEVLWLMAAKEQWLAGDVDGARETLGDAFEANPDSEPVWLAAVKLEWENDERERARALLARARSTAPSARVGSKQLLERECEDFAELQLLDEAITSYPSFHKFYLMAAQACESENKGSDKRLGDMKAARDFYQRGLKKCPKCAALWIGAAALEEKAFGATRARSVLELARSRNKGTPSLWLAAMRLERRHGHQKLAENLQAKALQECESSGELWADCISTAPRPARKGKSLEALKRCDNDARVIVAVANLFVSERKHNKARKWFARATALEPDLGDAWAHALTK